MARSHARIFTSIWRDDDWRNLSAEAQRVYLLLLSQPTMNHAGVLPLTVQRWANSCVDTDSADVIQALKELQEARYVVVDPDTEEVLVRSLMRRDGVWRQPNVLKAAMKEAVETTSSRLRQALSVEVRRMLEEDLPEGVRGELEAVSEAFASEPAANHPETWSEPFPNPSRTLPEPFEAQSLVVVEGNVGKDSPSTSTSPSTSAPPRLDVEQLCSRLADRIVENGSKRPNVTARWKREARLILDVDQRPLEQALRLIDWCQASTFWRANIMSIPKFRQKYDQLRLQAWPDSVDDRSDLEPRTGPRREWGLAGE